MAICKAMRGDAKNEVVELFEMGRALDSQNQQTIDSYAVYKGHSVAGSFVTVEPSKQYVSTESINTVVDNCESNFCEQGKNLSLQLA